MPGAGGGNSGELSQGSSSESGVPQIIKKPLASTLRTLRKRKHRLQGCLVRREMRARVTIQKVPACLPNLPACALLFRRYCV